MCIIYVICVQDIAEVRIGHWQIVKIDVPHNYLCVDL